MTSFSCTANSRQCTAPLLQSPKEALDDASLGPWVISYDEKSLSRSFVAKDWAAAMQFLNAVSLAAEAVNHHPDLHLTSWREVRVVLSTHSVGGLSTQDTELAKTIDAIHVDYSPKWLREQKVDASEAAAKFDESHYKFGLNGDFVQAGATEKFGGSETGGGGLFENEEMRDIAAAKDEIVKALRLVPGAVVADVGAGTGLLEPLLSEAVGEQGKVFASELSPVFRKIIQERCKDVKNVYLIDNPTDRDPKLPQDVDLVMLVDVYHHLEFPQTVLRKIRDSLKRHGSLVVIDFHRDPVRIKSHGEDWVFHHLRADQATFTKEIERTGFVQVEEVDVPGLPENYFLVFRKRPLPLSE
eukprot:CAMPEP_0119028316 /NCGR_PEP_ID=MMETSP1176-20130426/38672_1 /TAXON_ID=265551 /ORGANISM="Synedropsis recta cf, Strain CCMP1620" /LENGTH=355 /DNA_ID=CAMNT_0006984431 /DNA_START=86 /DNA_END=1150 /DNA_ORIENTATION=-